MVVHSYYPYDETRVQRQAEALIDDGYQVDVICLRRGNEPARELASGVTVYRLGVQRDKQRGAAAQFFEYLAFMLLAFFKLTARHLRQPYDTVQVHNLPDFLVFAALVPRLTGSRILLDLHDLMPEFYCAKFNRDMSSLPVRLVVWQERLACRFAHHVITVTELWRQTLYERGVPLEKSSVVMNLADPRYFDSSGARTRPAARGFCLIYHGTITQRYGVDLLLRAVARVRNQIPDLRLTIQGRGEYLEAVQSLIHSLGLEPIVQVRSDFLPATELASLIASSHLGIVPYRRDIFTDGILPTKLMEYMALGVPAIAARTPAISEYLDDSMVEFFTSEDAEDLANHILLLYRNPSRREELARNTSRFNQKYNWKSQSEKYVRLVEGLSRARAKRRDEAPLREDGQDA